MKIKAIKISCSGPRSVDYTGTWYKHDVEEEMNEIYGQTHDEYPAMWIEYLLDNVFMDNEDIINSSEFIRSDICQDVTIKSKSDIINIKKIYG